MRAVMVGRVLLFSWSHRAGGVVGRVSRRRRDVVPLAVHLEVDEPDAGCLSADQRNGAAPGNLLDPVRTHEVDEVVDLLGAAGRLDNDGAGGHVDDATAEDVDE